MFENRNPATISNNSEKILTILLGLLSSLTVTYWPLF